ncbi:unnamed protein product [Macrosiphum euphorbiae]|uniref:Attractin/MKLN-like beta-propeller domain-containing protein n=1 Tax=Macrosiphum euphorbiae TaxID=13131 RepID=A0AAV0WSX7_9HEMI|nr:unnamed protein product [Macrosiphum euphorbiae]
MSNNSISTYKFKPFEFTVLKENLEPPQRSLVRPVRRVVGNDAIFLFSEFKDRTNDAPGQRMSSPMHQIWKYSLDLGEWKVINCKNFPQELVTSCNRATLSGNIIIMYRSIGVTSGGIWSNRMYLGNLANEYKGNGMIFVNIKECGDFLLPVYILGVVMDGQYIYSIGNTYGNKNEMDVHRFDLSTKKWELLYKSVRERIVLEPRYQHEVVFYKSKIYIFAGKGGGNHPAVALNIFYDFSKIHMFDVDTKQWQLLSAKPDHRVPEPGYPIDRCFLACVQCPEKANLVYICGGLDYYLPLKDFWRIDFDTLQWEKLTQWIMPRPVYLHSTAISPSGRMYCYGGIVSENYIDYRNRSRSTNTLSSGWIKIPKLKDICWEAMIYYFKEQMFKSTDECLKKIGIPQEYYERIIEARRIC